jgi:hypothetical protein
VKEITLKKKSLSSKIPIDEKNILLQNNLKPKKSTGINFSPKFVNKSPSKVPSLFKTIAPKIAPKDQFETNMPTSKNERKSLLSNPLS